MITNINIFDTGCLHTSELDNFNIAEVISGMEES